MDIFLAWLVLASVQLAATLSPGPAFAVSVRNALAYDRRAGLFTAIGLGAGVGAHVIFVLCGIAVVISQSVLLFNVIKYVGAAYLIFIGFKAILARKKDAQEQKTTNAALDTAPSRKTISDTKAIQIGVLTNLLNPKAVIFFTAVYTQCINPETGWEILALYGVTSVIIEAGWFSCLAIILTNRSVKAKFMGFAHWIERVCGGLLMALGVRLALSKIH